MIHMKIQNEPRSCQTDVDMIRGIISVRYTLSASPYEKIASHSSRRMQLNGYDERVKLAAKK